ncbi:phosphoribosylformylglycinamidine synthase subunit PurL [Campylobacter ureolyticus]|uniref:Phosphoribosylformylglycinamidine synthase subunit PurL n=1 Tax=Campylobacter ureolyticus TaxID=827 RepID=A0AAE7EAQ8_9BACT|nr:phosphoribosylformylglycinamidine synthase subunit PurL [Campylobacter ureolyticus]MCR8684993.1 phosphoribosylformylglycinamidine synthase subunit PurL [Campylobacter ureolyticus]QKF84722.1 phosphoribosylformylglycinamidine synthase PurLQS, PurL subunit [Campylobacter ureolyticus]QQY35108.1 phosphoribosylformylglycinamidine synthase subunit PurL [Campylobacter ureolyticus]SUX21441.1 phosphoribosylformylglycinamidine synthase II [Campylobacter ureolyticus]
MDKETIKAHKITDGEYEKILSILNREPNLLELGVISAMWSEHCSYKSSKKYLTGFPTKAPWVIQGPGENAGVIDIGGDMAAVFKMESHNHPSYIEPFQGAATGVGGILRDIFTMGAKPVANLNSLRFGNIKTNKYQKHLLKGVASGIAHYGNCTGIPTIGGETTFDDSFDRNILVNAFCLGIVKKDEIFYAKASGVGNLIIYAGSKTGRDGLGGAVMASDSFNDENKALRPTVQVGDPFVGKLLMEACLELFKKDYIVGIQDMGAAGLTSSSFEMAGRSQSGMKLFLDQVPMREEGMTPYDLMLSESQERMLICAKKGFEDKVIEIFTSRGLDAAVVGEVTNTKKMELFWYDELVGELPIEPLSEDAPILDRPIKRPNYLDEIKNIKTHFSIPKKEAFLKLFSDENVVDKGYIYTQFDSTVGTNSVKKPGYLGANILRVKENGVMLSMGLDCNPKMNFVNPKVGASLAVATSGRKVAMSGAKPLAITDCLNYANPENPEIMWQFMMGCEGIKDACKELNTPVVSGNVSLYNDSDGINIHPTPAIVCVGVNENKNLPSIFKSGVSVYLVGETNGVFAGSLYQTVINNELGGELPEIDFEKEKALWDLIISQNKDDNLEFANSVEIGGIAITLAKMAAVSNIAGEFKTNFENENFIFDESFSRAIIGVKDEEKFKKEALNLGLKVVKLGVSGGDKFILDDMSFSIDKLREIYFKTLEKLI